MTLELRVGGVYRTRDGRRAEVVKNIDDSFVVTLNDDPGWWYKANGLLDGDAEGSEYTIISEVTDQPKTEQYDEWRFQQALALWPHLPDWEREHFRSFVKDYFAVPAQKCGRGTDPSPEVVERVASALFKLAHGKPVGERPTIGESARAAIAAMSPLPQGMTGVGRKDLVNQMRHAVLESDNDLSLYERMDIALAELEKYWVLVRKP